LWNYTKDKLIRQDVASLLAIIGNSSSQKINFLDRNIVYNLKLIIFKLLLEYLICLFAIRIKEIALHQDYKFSVIFSVYFLILWVEMQKRIAFRILMLTFGNVKYYIAQIVFRNYLFILSLCDRVNIRISTLQCFFKWTVLKFSLPFFYYYQR